MVSYGHLYRKFIVTLTVVVRIGNTWGKSLGNRKVLKLNIVDAYCETQYNNIRN